VGAASLQQLPSELLDLIAVHHFYLAVLENHLGHTVPLPREGFNPSGNPDHLQQSIETLSRWLSVLDLAISPPMVRDQLKATQQHDTAESLLRYYAKKASIAESDRDKCDCVLGFLCRNPRSSKVAVAERLKSGEDYQLITILASEFKTELNRTLADLSIASLQPEHLQLLNEFEFLYQELTDYRTFDKLMDSGILAKIRSLKQSFKTSFYHPDVLALAAVFNVVFGDRFDELFHAATTQIKNFAAHVQQEGGSIMSRVQGDILVKNLAEVEEESILNQEYSHARDDFRKISQFKKAVDTRTEGRPAAAAQKPVPVTNARAVAAMANTFRASAKLPDPEPVASEAAFPRIPGEDLKFNSMAEQIRTFVRAAGSKACFTVPLPKGAIAISPAEVEAFRADYGTEKSFRADFARLLMDVATARARVTSEMHDFQAKRNSAYLWKTHADSLTYLIRMFEQLQVQANQVLEIAKQRGLTEKLAAVTNGVTKLRTDLQNVAATLQSIQPER